MIGRHPDTPEGLRCSGLVCHIHPMLAQGWLPYRSDQGQPGNRSGFAGGRRIGGDPGGKGMGRVDNRRVSFLPKMCCQPRHAAEPAHAHLARKCARTVGRPRQRGDGDGQIVGHQTFGQKPRLPGAAENQDARRYRIPL